MNDAIRKNFRANALNAAARFLRERAMKVSIRPVAAVASLELAVEFENECATIKKNLGFPRPPEVVEMVVVEGLFHAIGARVPMLSQTELSVWTIDFGKLDDYFREWFYYDEPLTLDQLKTCNTLHGMINMCMDKEALKP